MKGVGDLESLILTQSFVTLDITKCYEWMAIDTTEVVEGLVTCHVWKEGPVQFPFLWAKVSAFSLW